MLVHEQHAGPFRNVVCCVDFSETSREAVEQARRVGLQDQSQVHFVHVYNGPWRGLPFDLESEQSIHEHDTQYRALIESRLKQFVGDVSGLKARFKVIESEGVSHGISEYARQTAADLIVLGNKGQSTFKAMLLGSTVERLLRELPCSILVVRPPTA
jgi:nucleotide-binding universal stress UspA family protein